MTTLSQLFEARVDAAPDAVAVEHRGSTLTYRAVDEAANRLAHRLRREGVGAGARVALFLERSPEMIVAMLAVVKAGAAYVPLDPSYPTERLALMLSDADPSAVITAAGLSAALPATRAGVIDVGSASLDDESRERLAPVVTGADRVHILYTSGSTGRPKGVCIRHRGVARLVLATNYIDFTPSARVAQVNNTSFDAATFEIWGALLNGACLVIVDRGIVLDPALFAAAIESLRITIMLVTTAIFNQIAEVRPESFRGVEYLVFGGEAASARAVRRVLEHKPAHLVNLYGPTESTVVATFFEIEALAQDAVGIPIGRPISDTTCHVLDENMQEVEAGELHIGGDGNAEGYWRRPELTAERFVRDPFSDDPSATLYKTGDLVRRLADGNLEFVGRIDDQVKVGGYRIELGEIEASLAARANVSSATVIAREDDGGPKRLVAYVVGENGATLTPGALRAALRAELPAHMVPSAFVVLDALPLTPNGKVDRQGLPAPDAGAFAVSDFVEPRTPTERAVAKAFADVLHVSRVGAHDDFFLLGGQSLLAMQVSTRIAHELRAALPVRAIFDAPTVEALARHVDTAAASSPAREEPPLARASRTGNRLPLSRLQERLWFFEKLEPGSNAYLVFMATRLRGPLQLEPFERAWAELGRRHESLRTTFEEKDGTAVQVVHDVLPIKCERRDLSKVPAAERERVALEQAKREATTAFDLRRGPLCRVKLLALDKEDHILLVTMHHIISDGWSLGVVARELSALYAAFASGAEPTLPALGLHYGDYAGWDRQRTSEATTTEQLAYWKAHLAGAPAALELPTDRPRPPAQKHRGAQVRGEVGAHVADRLRSIGRRHGATLYMALLASFSALLARLSGQHDVVVATPVVNRPRAETEDMIGFFMNTLALRVDVTGDPSFEELLGRAREASLGAFANQDVPFDRIVQEVNPARDMSRNPIAQVSLNVLNLPDMRVRLPGVEAQAIAGVAVGSKFDFTLYVDDREGLRFELVYDPELFDEPRMARFLRRFEVLLEEVAANPSARIGSLSLVSEEERRILPDPRAPLPPHEHTPIPALFDAHVEARSDRIAVEDPRRRWTYAELGGRADQLSAWLTGRGIESGDIVAIFAERNALAALAILGVMKSGAAFMLLDAAYPPARLAEQLAIAKPAAWINASETIARPAELDAAMPVNDRIADLLDEKAAWSTMPRARSTAAIDGDTRAYVAFTSGTSGGPKAVLGSHRPLAHFVDWHTRAHELTPDDRFSGLSGLAHDPFLRDVLTPLALGASLHLPAPELRLEPDELATWMSATRITVAHLTPSLGEVLALARAPVMQALRLVCFAGEKLRGELTETLHALAPAARFVSFYGATETPQAMGFHSTPNTTKGIVPAGRGIDGVQLLVLTPSGALAAVDEEGEICVRTPYLAVGYLDRSDGGFGQNPFTSDASDRIYRTGDRGRYRADGVVEVLGRLDDQVKVRGFRVELADVTGAIRAQQGVRQAAVVLDEKRRALVAYVVGDIDAGALTKALRARLPDYMVPSSVVHLETIPLTPNGKLDRRALPAPQERPADAPASAEDGDVISTITELWKEVLEVDEVGLHDNFFDLGGHSLLATQLAVRLRDAFDVEVPVRTIFEAPTVAELAERIITLIVESASPEDLAAAMRDIEGEPRG